MGDEFEGRELIEVNLQRAVGEYEAKAFMFLIDKWADKRSNEAVVKVQNQYFDRVDKDDTPTEKLDLLLRLLNRAAALTAEEGKHEE